MKLNEETIFNYLDGQLDKKDQERFLEALESDNEFRKLFEYHKGIHDTLEAEQLPGPAPGFTERVLETVYSLQANRTKFFNRSRLFVISLIGIILITTVYYFSIKLYPTLGESVASDITMREFTLNLGPAKNFLNSDLLFKIVFYVNGIVGLFLLDRAVLKPYFARRRERYSM